MTVQKLIHNSQEALCDNKILTYKLEHSQLEILQETIKNKKINGQNIVIYEAQNFADILSNTYLIAFLNFFQVKVEEKELFLNYFKECIEKSKLKKEVKSSSLNIPLTYILNAEENGIMQQPYLYMDSNIFEQKEKLRLTLLQKIMEFDGRRRMRMAGDMPQRTVRVMVMHRYLLTYGWISKDKCDKICKALGYEVISDRSFHRDINLIRYIEHVYDEDIIYDEETRRYELKNEDKISG